MAALSSRLSVDSTKLRQAKTTLKTRTTQETIEKALDLAITWEEARSTPHTILAPEKQRQLDLLLDAANAGQLTRQQGKELERIIKEAQLLTIRKARLLAGTLAK
jgi:hypothetical protein